MANQTIFKLHTVMPRSFDFETNFPYLPRERLLIPTSRPQNSPSLNATASLFICLIKGAVSQYSHTSLICGPSIPCPSPSSTTVLWSPTELSTPPRPGPSKCCLSSRSHGSSACAALACRRRARFRCNGGRGGANAFKECEVVAY
jgi:hypothetical protein